MEYQVPFTMKEQLPNLFRHWICRDADLAYLENGSRRQEQEEFSGDHEPAKSLYFQRSVEQYRRLILMNFGNIIKTKTGCATGLPHWKRI